MNQQWTGGGGGVGAKRNVFWQGLSSPLYPSLLRRRFQFNTVSHFSFSSFGQFLVRVWKKELVDIFFRFQGDGTTTLMGPTQLGKNFPKMCFDSGRTIFPAPKVLRFPHFDPDFFVWWLIFQSSFFPLPPPPLPPRFELVGSPAPPPKRVKSHFFVFFYDFPRGQNDLYSIISWLEIARERKKEKGSLGLKNLSQSAQKTAHNWKIPAKESNLNFFPGKTRICLCNTV